MTNVTHGTDVSHNHKDKPLILLTVNNIVMKTKYLYSVLLLLAGWILTSLISPQVKTGPHGGSVRPAETYLIEMKTEYPDFYAYLLRKNLESIGNKYTTCDARFYMDDNTTMDISLQRFGEEGFKAKLAAINYISCRITFHMGRNSFSAKFDNENAIVQQKNSGNKSTSK